MKTVLLFFSTSFLSSVTCLGFLDKIVNTPLGKIEGTTKLVNYQPVQAFLGIPYAKPPTGDLRFLKPVSVEPWSGIFKAKNLPPACHQFTKYPFPWYDSNPGQSEDCLYLNIYAPMRANPGSKLAVIFWVHGGGFTVGSNRLDIYDASALSQEGDVIVVVINYRLGVLGFLTTGGKDESGNAGLYDMLMALKWVNDNIESFGGDKSRITIAGESAGSIAISVLCVSPLTKGLFSKAILESGSVVLLKDNPYQRDLELSQRLAKTVGCATDYDTIENSPDNVLNCLRGKDAAHLVNELWAFNPTAARSFDPKYGTEFLPNNAVEDIRKGNFNNVSLLIGNNRDEGSFHVTTTDPQIFGFFGEKYPQINKTLAATMIGKFFRNYTNPEKYVNYYLKDIPDNDYDAIRQQIYQANGDSTLMCPTKFFAESYGNRNNDVYYYFFVHRPKNSPWTPWMGVVHFEEVQFVFGRPLRVPQDYTISEVQLSRRMMRIWSKFAKYDNPFTYPKWPKYSKSNPTFLFLDVDIPAPVYGTGPYQDNCNLLREHFGF